VRPRRVRPQPGQARPAARLQAPQGRMSTQDTRPSDHDHPSRGRSPSPPSVLQGQVD
jgi:hypothetical protein